METKYPGVYCDKTKTKFWTSFYYVNNKGKRVRKFKRGFRDIDEALSYKLSFTANPSKNAKFKEVALDYLLKIKNNNKPGTYETYKMAYNEYLKNYFADMRIDKILIPHIIDWKEQFIKKAYSDSTNDKAYSLLCSILNHANKFYGLKNNVAKLAGPFKKQNLNKIKKKLISYKDFKFFYEVIESNRDKSIFLLLFFCGYRVGELLALCWDDVDLENNVIEIKYNFDKHTREKNSTKNAKGKRKTKIPNIVKDVLNEYLQEQLKANNFSLSNWIFPGVNNNPLSRTTLNRIKNEYIKKSGVDYFTLKDFRMSKDTNSLKFVSNMEELFALADATGHTKEVMLKYYISSNIDKQNKFVNSMEKEFLDS